MPLLFPFKVQTGSNIVCRVRFTRVGDVPYYMCNLDTAAEQAAGASMIHRVQLSPDLVQAFEHYTDADQIVQKASTANNAVSWSDLATTRKNFCNDRNECILFRAALKAYATWIKASGRVDESEKRPVGHWLEIPAVWSDFERTAAVKATEATALIEAQFWQHVSICSQKLTNALFRLWAEKEPSFAAQIREYFTSARAPLHQDANQGSSRTQTSRSHDSDYVSLGSSSKDEGSESCKAVVDKEKMA